MPADNVRSLDAARWRRQLVLERARRAHPATRVRTNDLDEEDLDLDEGGCEECGDDDGPYLHEGRHLCLDCLENE